MNLNQKKIFPTMGENIRIARKKANMTQKELGEQCGVKHNVVSDWENNKYCPDGKTIGIICMVTDTEPNAIYNYGNNELAQFAEALKELDMLDGNGKLDDETFNKLIEFVNANKKFILSDESNK